MSNIILVTVIRLQPVNQEIFDLRVQCSGLVTGHSSDTFNEPTSGPQLLRFGKDIH